jgi:hypothetical protein
MMSGLADSHNVVYGARFHGRDNSFKQRAFGPNFLRESAPPKKTPSRRKLLRES